MLVKQYKKHKIEKNNGIYEVVTPKGSRYVIALDDSKSSGKKRFINKDNNLKTAKMFIDLITN